MPTGGQITQLEVLERGVVAGGAFSPDGASLAVGGGTGIWVYVVNDMDTKPPLPEWSPMIWHIARSGVFTQHLCQTTVHIQQVFDCTRAQYIRLREAVSIAVVGIGGLVAILIPRQPINYHVGSADCPCCFAFRIMDYAQARIAS